MRKGECEGKREERSLEKSLEVGFETGKARKDGLSGAKNERVSSKIARNRVRNGEKWEKRRSRGEKGGVG